MEVKYLVLFVLFLLFVGLLGFYYVNSPTYQMLNDGRFIEVEKNEVFIVSDNTTYKFKEGCLELLEYYRVYSSNIPEIIKKRCVFEN